MRLGGGHGGFFSLGCDVATTLIDWLVEWLIGRSIVARSLVCGVFWYGCERAWDVTGVGLADMGKACLEVKQTEVVAKEEEKNVR